MPSTSQRAAVLALLAALAGTPRAGEAAVTEQWYLLRGRSNLGIKNYRAAIEAFQRVLELDPGHREASRSLALAYELNGETDRAIAQLDAYLARFHDDPEMAFKQARWLGWVRYAYRRNDAIRYYRMGLARRDDPARRRELARLLGRDRATLDDALSEYRTLLALEPEDVALRAEFQKLLVWDPRHRTEAIAELTRDLDARPGDGAGQLRLARLLAEEGRADEAVDRYRRSLARRPDAQAEVELARVLVKARRRGEALEAYARAVEQRPDDTALALEHARVLSSERSRRAEALAEYRRVLRTRRDPAVRLEHATLLAAEDSGREQALSELETLSREHPRSSPIRLRYARLLEADRDTTAAAIAQYRRELAARPDSVEAHAGLARAYAWTGDADRALWHADRALGREPGLTGMAQLRADLGRGREPWGGGAARALSSGSGGNALLGFQGGLRGSREVTPFARATVEGGGETYQGEGRSVAGAYVGLAVEARPGTNTRVDGALQYDAVRGGDGAVTGRASLTHGQDVGVAFSVFGERRARTDSLTAYAGDAAARFGVATENVGGVSIALPAGSLRVELRPEAGEVTHRTTPANAYLGGTATLSAPLSVGGAWRVSAAFATRAAHYAEDRSAVAGDPRPSDGYFSPSLFLSETVRAVVVHEVLLRSRFELAAGPALQLLDGAPGAGLHLGGDARAALWWRAGDRLWWSLSAAYERVGTSYTRLEAAAALAAYL
jgi:tetratricopeptide (TPR) repeat protein